MNARLELVSLLRGSVAAPVIASLAELGLIERICQRPFVTTDFPELRNEAALSAVFRYLQALGLLSQDIENDSFRATELGKSVFRRAGAFLILESYRDYFDHLGELLSGEQPKVVVHRQRNVIGSGRLHGQKFFPTAFEFLGNSSVNVIVDLGCGDGTFLAHSLAKYPDAALVAVDQSQNAICATRKKLPLANLRAVVADAFDVSAWAPLVPQTESVICSMWFTAHEFSNGTPERVIDFFSHLSPCLPSAEVLLGEIVNVSPSDLAESHMGSVMPEFLFFHSLSGQGVLTWDQFRYVKDHIPYNISSERRFDEIFCKDGGSIPSAFIWHLTPRG